MYKRQASLTFTSWSLVGFGCSLVQFVVYCMLFVRMSTNIEKNSAVSEEGHVSTAYDFFLIVSDFNFPKVCSKTLLDSSTLRRFLAAIRELYVAYSKLCKGKLFNRKRKPHNMSEKRHKINKFANYQNNYNGEKQSRLQLPCFLFLLKTVDLWFLT